MPLNLSGLGRFFYTHLSLKGGTVKAITVIEHEDGRLYVARSGTEDPDETIGLLHRGIDVTIQVEGLKAAKEDHA